MIIASDAHEAKILSDLGITTSTPSGGWDRFDEAHSNQWQSVFDTNFMKKLLKMLLEMMLVEY